MSLEAGAEFEALIDYLRDSRGFDFSGYKRATLIRRVVQRCRELGIDSFRAYQDYLQVHGDEFGALFDKILINVTEFFRDPPAWDYLAKNVIPRIAAKPGDIRVWSAGTSSGQEAYSAAILFAEALGEEQYLARVKIYATDIDDAALGKARAGYTRQEVESVPEDLRSRYFEQQGERFLFRSTLRRSTVFGHHDLTQDAPISRVDLLLCRNCLIYLIAEAQGRILARFHYALNDDGYLFLGRSEMLLSHASLFTPLESRVRIFSKVAKLQLRERLLVLAQSGSAEAGNHVVRQLRVRELTTEGSPFPQIVVDAAGVLVSANQPARELLEIPPADIGRALKDVELSYRPIDMRTPLDKVIRDRKAMSILGVELSKPNGSIGFYDIVVSPLIDEDAALVGVAYNFIDVTQSMQLRVDLERMTNELRSSREELETVNEELQSTIEELETTNEELQSTNEELETLNEELESTNSELNRTNDDLEDRSLIIQRLNTMLLAITGNIEVGAAVLDKGMRVQVWNERAADLWGVRSDEVVGQSFFNLDIGLPAEQLRTLVTAGAGGTPRHDELVVTALTRRGRQIHCRVVAHTLGDGERPTGVVVVMEELKA